MSLTQQEWDLVEARLQPPFGMVDLVVDGYMVTLKVERTDKMRFGIIVYVGGQLKGSWVVDDCEERRRFMREVRIAAYSKELRTKYKKLSRSTRRRLKFDPDAKISTWTWVWPSFGPLKRHLIKHNSQFVLASGVASV